MAAFAWRRTTENDRLQRALTESNRELHAQRAELETLATSDPLTGLLNRRAFDRLAEHDLALARRQGTALSLLMVDLDHFKAINDRFGHATGDEVLRVVAARMAGSVRKTDRVARFGGEEFVLLLPDTSRRNAAHLAEKLRATVGAERVPGLDAPLTASVGVACVAPGVAVDLHALVRQADQALYRAKEAGRDRIDVVDV